MRIKGIIKIMMAVTLLSTTAIYFWINGIQTVILISQTEDDFPSYSKIIRVHLSGELDMAGNSKMTSTSPPIYFLMIIKNTTGPVLKYRTACAIESASMHNPTSTVHAIFVTSCEKNKINNNSNLSIVVGKPIGNNVQVWYVTAGKILQNTPLEKWYSNRTTFEGGKYELTHLSDALRIAILWKYGGIYLDTDVWSVKSIVHLQNTIGAENNIHVNGAVMMFDSRHQYLHNAMTEFAKVYNKSAFVVVGPELLTNVLKKKCRVFGKFDSVSLSSYKQCSDVTVLEPSAFYPVNFNDFDDFYSGFFQLMYNLNLWKNSYTFHLWNQITGSKKLKMSVSWKTLLEGLAEHNCPHVYKLMQKEGQI